MKNKKIVALLCAMAMIITTLSSIFTVSAAKNPALSINVDEQGDNGHYLVKVQYAGCDSNVVGATITVPIPEDKGVKYVDKSIKKSDGFKGQVNYADNAVNIAAGDLDGIFAGNEGVLCTFEVEATDSMVKDVVLEFDKEETVLDDMTDGPANLVTYTIGDAQSPLSVTSGLVEYVRPEIPNAPRLELIKEAHGDDSYTIKIAYDISELDKAAGKEFADIVGLTIELPIPEGMEYVDNSLEKLNGFKGQVNYADNAVNIAAGDLDGIFIAAKGEFVKFDVKILTDTATMKFSDIVMDDVTKGAVDMVSYDIDTCNYNSLKLKKGEKPVVTDPPAVTTPPVAETTPPAVTTPPASETTPPASETTPPAITDAPSSSTTPMPVQITVDKYTNSNLIGKDKAGVQVTLKSINLAEVKTDKVDIVIQGFTKADGKGTSCGNVIIPEIDITNNNLLDIPFTGYVAGAKSFVVNVYDHNDPNRVLAARPKPFNN